MEKFYQLQETYPWFLPVLMTLIIWEAVWKLIALWKSARNGHVIWFICIAIFNTVGIVPILYILLHSKSSTNHD